MTIIPALPNLLIDEVQVAEEITISLRATSAQACCLCCGTASSRVQSRYQRMLHDLPSSVLWTPKHQRQGVWKPESNALASAEEQAS